jgi:hypothetical protein
MIEKSIGVPHYTSPLRKVNPNQEEDFARIETYKGNVAVLLRDIGREIKNIEQGRISDENSLTLFYRTYELIKMTVNEKVDIDRQKKGHDQTLNAITAVRLAVRLAMACDLQDPNARELLQKYRKLVGTTELKSILKKTLNEAADRGIMPDHPAEEDLKIAEDIVEKTKKAGKKDIVLVGIGHRGTRREIDIYLDSISLLKSTDSRYWSVRSSDNYFDRGPNLSWQEENMIKTWIEEGRQLVIVGPEERMEKAKAILRGAIPRKDGKKIQEPIVIYLPVAKMEDNQNGNNV